MLNFITAYNKSKFTITKAQNNLAKQYLLKFLSKKNKIKN